MRRSDARCLQILVLSALILSLYLIAHRGFPRPTQDFGEIARKLLQYEYKANRLACGSSTAKSSLTVIVQANLNEQSMLTQTVASVLASTDAYTIEKVYILIDHTVNEEHRTLILKNMDGFGSTVDIVELGTKHSLRSTLEIAAEKATGDTVLMLTDGVILSPNYLPPLIQKLKEYPEAIAIPSLDYVSPKTNTIESYSSPIKWTFNLQLTIIPFEVMFGELVEQEDTHPITSPAMDGSIFTLTKDYLQKLLVYDEHKITTHIGLSFYTWLWGQGIHIIPCSRAARTSSYQEIQINDVDDRRKIAEMYMSSNLMNAYNKVNPEASAGERSVQAKGRGQEHDFNWYISHIVKDSMFIPTDDTVAYGRLRSVASCFSQSPAMTFLALPSCEILTRGQMVEYTKHNQLKVGGECMQKNDKMYIVTEPCISENVDQKWERTELLQFQIGELCLSHATDPYAERNHRQIIMFSNCHKAAEEGLKWQRWTHLLQVHQ